MRDLNQNQKTYHQRVAQEAHLRIAKYQSMYLPWKSITEKPADSRLFRVRLEEKQPRRTPLLHRFSPPLPGPQGPAQLWSAQRRQLLPSAPARQRKFRSWPTTGLPQSPRVVREPADRRTRQRRRLWQESSPSQRPG